MDKLLHVDSLIFITLSIETLSKVGPAKTCRAMQSSPAVRHINLAAVEMKKEFFEPSENIVSLPCVEAMRHDHMASNQEDNFDLSLNTAACRENEFVVCVPSCNLISYLIELVDIDQ